jgi:hypothetical protein
MTEFSHSCVFLSNRCGFSLPQFGALLFLVFSMELTAAVLGYMMHGQVSYMLIRTMNDAFLVYKENTYVASSIDFLQINVS